MIRRLFAFLLQSVAWSSPSLPLEAPAPISLVDWEPTDTSPTRGHTQTGTFRQQILCHLYNLYNSNLRFHLEKYTC